MRIFLAQIHQFCLLTNQNVLHQIGFLIQFYPEIWHFINITRPRQITTLSVFYYRKTLKYIRKLIFEMKLLSQKKIPKVFTDIVRNVAASENISIKLKHKDFQLLLKNVKTAFHYRMNGSRITSQNPNVRFIICQSFCFTGIF